MPAVAQAEWVLRKALLFPGQLARNDWVVELGPGGDLVVEAAVDDSATAVALSM